jgi:hypothetical protein
MAQDQNLHILGGGAAGEQPESAEDRDTDQIQQSKQHDSRSCHDHVEPKKPQLTALVTSFGTLHRLRPMRGLTRLRSTRVISAAHAFVQNLRRGHYKLSVDIDPRHQLTAIFVELARAI